MVARGHETYSEVVLELWSSPTWISLYHLGYEEAGDLMGMKGLRFILYNVHSA